DGCRPEEARPLVDLLLAAPGAGPAAVELAGCLRALDGDDEGAAALLAAAATGSVRERAAAACARVADLRRALALRAVVDARPVDGARVGAARRALLAAPWRSPGAVEAAAVRYVACAVADGDVRDLDGLVGPLLDGGALHVSELDAPGVAHLVARATVLADDADHDGALHLLRGLPALPEALTGPALLLLARLLTATSRYAEARTLLAVAGSADDAATAAAAHLQAARVAWVRHDHDGVRAETDLALAAGAPARAVRGLRRDALHPRTPAPDDAPTDGVGHVAFYVDPGGNFGDVALPLAVREAVEDAAGPRTWVPFHAHQLFDADRVRVANAQRALVVGGGGLFLPDTAPNGHSGWQWNVPAASLAALDVPLFVFAVGYNLFDGQEFHGARFRDGLVALARRAELVGLRNHGSMERVRALLPDDLAGRVRFVPCPTTVYERLHPDLPAAETGTGRVLLNAAFDRSARRFQGGYRTFLAQVRDVVARASRAGAEVRVVAHTRGDTRLAHDLRDAHGLDLPVDELHLMDPGEAFGVYRRASLVVGMRGHATMIPFGLGTPVLSLVSHPKMRYFLDDVGRPGWGFDARDPRLGPRLAERALDVLAREQEYRDDVRALQLDLLPHVQDAAGRVAAALGAPARTTTPAPTSAPTITVPHRH
ncbi:polysaccharide pyruvyl transferase family protein, partial [Isoptericola sp. NPDC057191]|uniref:polysaccharide pyruvyl transferase family protein n=1 Tax=Isoptericola sp. NPDC057191 TaxID=3346041 RepID=UPI0036351882